MAQPSPQIRSLPDWSSGLPEELLESISKRLASGHNAASFRSVCSPWRAAVPFATFGPLLLPPFDPDSDIVGFYCVSEEKAFTLTLPGVRGKVPWGVSCGWLALMDAAASVTLLNPFTGARVEVELPPADEHVAAATSPAERVSKVHGRWVLHSGTGDGNVLAANSAAIKLEDVRGMFFHEIVLSAPPEAGRECVAMAVLASSTEVAFCRVGVDSAWTLLDTRLECSVAVGVIPGCDPLELYPEIVSALEAVTEERVVRNACSDRPWSSARSCACVRVKIMCGVHRFVS